MTKRSKALNVPGQSKEIEQSVLLAGSKLLQTHAPLKNFDMYVAGFHPAKEDPHHQMEAHHFCRQVNKDFLQCVLFDGNTRDANLIGIEYIVSERIFDSLEDEEKEYWHPHNYEILSGQLVAPGLPDRAEKRALRFLMNSYGKTWHLWNTGRYDGKGDADELPLGEPKLMWSFNRDGEADPTLERDRDVRMNLDTPKKRHERQEFVSLAHPQEGVDTLKGAFTHADDEPPPGVRQAKPD